MRSAPRGCLQGPQGQRAADPDRGALLADASEILRLDVATGPAADHWASSPSKPPGSFQNPRAPVAPPSVTASKAASVIGSSDSP
ncbi:hypothetical protein ACIHIX_14875 [Streptomyces sp. NPDC051913]|uniref:hypothetical protein n=1 Tax=Streptomyces sp. NPDC051913 TaxID=3365676 RepID=UPI0037D3B9E7